MSDVKPRWYPLPDHPRQDTDRIIFDNLYELRDMVDKKQAESKGQAGAMSVTAVVPGGFTVGSKSYTSLIFQNGRLVGVA